MCGIISFANTKKYDNACLVLIGIILIIHCGLRTTDADHPMYENLYYNIDDAEIEPSFKLIVRIAKFVIDNEPIIMFILYSIIGVTLKLSAINILSNFKYLSIAIYLSQYFILQEMTQIRAGVAGGLFLLSIKPLYNKEWIKVILLLITASLFHYSAIALFLILFLNPYKLNKRFWLSLIPLVYLLRPLIYRILSLLVGISLGFEKIDAYIYALSNLSETTINIFSPIQIIRIFLAFIVVIYISNCIANTQYAYILIKIYILGVVCLVIFSAVNVIAYRVSELFLLSEIIIVPYLGYIIKPRPLGKTMSLIYCMLLLTIMISQSIFDV